MKPHIDIPKEEVAAFCRRWQVTELALFGSVLREDFRPDSDVDVLVRFNPQDRHRHYGTMGSVTMENFLINNQGDNTALH